MENKRLKKYVNEKENVFLLDIICFEYILLEFKELIEWIYAPEDEFLQKRARAIVSKVIIRFDKKYWIRSVKRYTWRMLDKVLL